MIKFSLTQMEYVLAVNKWKHFAKAAAACHVSQPSLSMQIQKLEADLGVVIFDRTKKPILLTEVGQKIVNQMQIILSEANKVEHLVTQQAAGGVRGSLTLGIIPTMMPNLLPMFLPVVREKFPELELRVRELQTHQIVEKLGLDEIDVGLLATPLKENGILEIPLFYEPFFVYCHSKHPLAQFKKVKFSSLHYDDIWLLEDGHCMRNQIIDICSLRKNVIKKSKLQLESGDLETLKNLVEKGGGFTLIPELSIPVSPHNASVLPFERPIPAREVGLVYRRAHYKSDLIEALGEAILESLPMKLKQLRPKDLDVVPIK